MLSPVVGFLLLTIDIQSYTIKIMETKPWKPKPCINCGKDIRFFGKNVRCSKCSWTKERIENMRSKRMGKLNPNWSGDHVGYAALHDWVKSHLKKPRLCDMCKVVPPYDLANKGVYNRNLSNWEWLCRKCHMLSDGRMDRLREILKKRATLVIKICESCQKEYKSYPKTKIHCCSFICYNKVRHLYTKTRRSTAPKDATWAIVGLSRPIQAFDSTMKNSPFWRPFYCGQLYRLILCETQHCGRIYHTWQLTI